MRPAKTSKVKCLFFCNGITKFCNCFTPTHIVIFFCVNQCSIHIKNVKFCVLRQHFTYIIPIHDSEILSMFYDRIYHPFIRSCYTNTIFVSDHPTLYISCYTNLGSIFDYLALTDNLIFFQCITTLYFDSISRVNSTSFFVAAPGSS